MSKQVRKIIEIDEEKCTGCGLCIIDCAEGALAIVDGKAKIVKDSFCDGLGACLGACPEDALKIIEREADDFDEEAAMEWVAQRDGKAPAAHHGTPAHAPIAPHGHGHAHAHGQAQNHGGGCACAGSMAKQVKPIQAAVVSGGPVSGPGHWPLKIRLVPPTADYLKGADVLVAADCASAASPIFHSEFARGKVVLIGCPKFDDTDAYVQKITDILSTSGIKSISVLRMEVPCCRGLSASVFEAAKRAFANTGNSTPVQEIIMTCGGARAEQTLFGQ
ncbi:4Fe-4S dicluster domain-containing protein [Desulfovibrio mangrovi]|uniref:ATP-binding protein n=1 Tax=Desulfovibrio mangrovi TaxID=2976983 RepID=UPI002245E979|nr:4Fe-4S dicluster domain-containing protein [Desulfovibrio mangrovi]UZP68987.1 4Fe-4S dicluster domain-containing protein [Desulfovibrio mangrovi]